MVILSTSRPQRSLAIIGLGMSNRDYLLDAADWRTGRKFDAVWTLNRGGTIFRADCVFRMDDYHLMEAKGEGEQYINKELVDLASGGTKVFTSAVYPECSTWDYFPLSEFLTRFKTVDHSYVNSSVPYMIGHAIICGYTELHVYGMDYNYAPIDLAGKGVAPTFAEDGRACTEYWLGVAESSGVKVLLPRTSTLMGACRPEHMYGYKDGAVDELAIWREANAD